MEKRISNVRSRKIRGSRTSRASRIAERSKTGPHTGVRQGCTAVHPGQKVPRTAQGPHGRPCLDARPAVRLTHGRAWGHARPCVVARPCHWWSTAVPRPQSRAVPRVFVFLSVLRFIFGGRLFNLSQSIFRVELELGLG